MATTNHERVGKAMESLKAGLAPFVGREFTRRYKGQAPRILQQQGIEVEDYRQPFQEMDVAALLKVMWNSWNEVYRDTLGRSERNLVSELRDVRNRWAHQEPFNGDDTYRALDSTERLLSAVSAPQAAEIAKMKQESLRVRFDEQARTQRRRTTGAAVESQATGGLTPWREVVVPHQDVRGGDYQQAEFAADLWQVHLGQGAPEYRDAAEFFRRTYLTDSLTQLLGGAVRRLAGRGGDPVVQLQTNFGGGKTHAMLALYHLFSGTSPGALPGMDAVLPETGVSALPAVKRVVLVGNRISPGNPVTKEDGTQVRTLWGELAWQLGFAAGGVEEARRAYERVRADDERATNPGDTIRVLLNDYGPCLILIDEWVAYARQLHDEGDLPAGSFETQFSFAQALTESAKLAENCLLVVSLPASDASDSDRPQADDSEVGGVRGRSALSRLSNVIGRVDSSWRPASAEESFEIVRRRLFQPITEREKFATRDNVARAFCDLYRASDQEFPPECAEADYEKRIAAAYPVHPEIFDRLYSDWSTLPSFQRTRGVLRLMAAVIHGLWEKNDRNPLILPANIPLDDSRVRFEFTRYLPENWVPVIETDIDGANSLPQRLDAEVPNLGKYGACRRVARSIYLGSAPTPQAANPGLEDRRVKLGCAMPRESPAVFGDAMRRMGSQATYLYQDGVRYWYSTQPTVAKLAEGRAEERRRRKDELYQDIETELRKNLEDRGDFNAVHPFPASGHEVQDDRDARLVVLRPDHAHVRDETSESRALVAAKSILASRGNQPRLFQNALAFLAADETRLQDLEQAVSLHQAWRSIVEEQESLNLPPQQVRQAESQRDAAAGAVETRIGETYQWLLAPSQKTPEEPVEWLDIRLSGRASLAERASRKMRNDELLVNGFAPSRLRMELDGIPLWRGDHVAIGQLVEDFARYIYLPRLQEPAVLLDAIQRGLSLMTWQQDSFAYADSYDEDAGRYRGLSVMQATQVGVGDPGLLVRPEVAQRQLDAEAPAPDGPSSAPQPSDDGGIRDPSPGEEAVAPSRPQPKRYHGAVKLDPTRAGRDASEIQEEVIAHLAALVDADVTVTLEIDARIPDGAPEDVVRVVTENSRTLKFEDAGFESE